MIETLEHPDATLALLRAERERRRTRQVEFINDQQRAFFESQAAEVLYSGAFRAGKSRIGCEKAYALARRYPGIPIGIFRKAYANLAASTERTLIVDVIPRSEIARSNATQHWYELDNGSRIWLFGLDADPVTGQPSRVGSVELGWAFVDEAVEVTEADWEWVKGRLSWPGIPYHQLTGATNPGAPKHWLKRRFTPPTPSREYLRATTFDNPTLPADYVEEARAKGDGYFKSRYVLGEWIAAEGQIWLLPDDQVRDPEPAADGGRPSFKRVVAGIDWGFVHAFACEVVGMTGSGRLAVIDEVYERGRTIDQVIPALQLMRELHGIETFYADPSEPAYILQCQRAGLPVKAATNDVDPGIQAVQTAIRSGMTVTPSAEGLLGEIPGYTWAPDRMGGFKEKPVEIGDDACDALRYAVMGVSTVYAAGWGAVTDLAGTVA